MQKITTKPNTLKQAADDTLHSALSFLRPKDVGSVSQASRFFYNLTRDNAAWSHFLTPSARARVATEQLDAREELQNHESSRLPGYRSVRYFHQLGIGSITGAIHYIRKGFLTSVEQALDLSGLASILIEDRMIQNFIGDDFSLFQKVLSVTSNEHRQNLLNTKVQRAIKNNELTFDQGINLTQQQINQLD